MSRYKLNIFCYNFLIFICFISTYNISFSQVPIECPPGYISNWTLKEGRIYTHRLGCDVKVGIGIYFPLAELHVSGTTIMDKLLVGKSLEAGFSGLISGAFSTTNPLLSSPPLINLGIYNPNTQATSSIFVVDPNGNLILRRGTEKIFQINSSNKTVYAQEIILQNQLNWPDYVFKKEYPLLPLKKVQAYIEENGHLPNVPSANEVAEQGLSLGGMTKITMEKIEELTLYLLQMNERLEQQEVNLVEQQNLIDEQAKLIQLQQLMIEQLKIDKE